MLLSLNQLDHLELGTIQSTVNEVIARNSQITHVDVGSPQTANITKLDLRGNLMTEINELDQLKSLKQLDVSSNPILPQNFNDRVMRSLGATLKTIHIGHPTSMTSFPRGISEHLQFLSTLEINGASLYFQYLPPTAFRTFQFRLANLTIRNTHMQTIPLTLRDLRALTELHFDGNPIGDYGLLPESFTGLTQLTTLTLKNDGLTKFPEIVDRLPNLDSLSLDGNRLLFIREAAIDLVNSSKISDLSLSNCSLDRIPGAIAFTSGDYLNTLRHLHLDDNNIQSIDRNDLHDLSNLQSISFANNPLQYISERAFLDMPRLTKINLADTEMRNIPIAVQNVDKPSSLSIDLTGTSIECTCALVDFQKVYMDRSRTRIQINGVCDTINQSIHDYLESRIPTCPDYSH